MIKVSAFDNGGLFIVNSDHIVKIVVAEAEVAAPTADDETAKKRVIAEGVVIVLANGQAHHVRESMSHFVRLFFDSNDDSV
jgi:uncharacterized protein YlzI (FlbEa/FlbD family)